MSARRVRPPAGQATRAWLAPLLLVVAACVSTPGVPGVPMSRVRSSDLPSGRPVTRPERTGFRETSTYDDVIAFVDSLEDEAGNRNLPLHVDTLGRTTEGRWLPLVVLSRPLVRTPAEARALRRPIVYVQGNIHAGEVEGKEALQILMRTLALARGPSVLDSVVFVAVPIYNADGNERWGPQERQRSEQNGPERVGQRPNAMGLDLNRDYIKAEAPETRASLAAFRAWDPDVFVDLHTTNGSYHGYALTYSPSLHPGAPLAEWTREWLGVLRHRMETRHDFATFDYGNFATEYGADANADTTKQGWFTYDHRPRFGTNYYGLRDGVAILSEAYSHDPFDRRVKATYHFVREILGLTAERGAELQRRREAARASRGPAVLRAALTTRPSILPMIAEDLARVADTTVRSEPGVPRGLRRTGRFRTVRIPVHDRFDATLTRPLPWGWVVPDDSAVAERLRLHGVPFSRLSDVTAELERFTVDSIVRATRPFQGHQEVRVVGRWSQGRETIDTPVLFVRADGPLPRVAAQLLEPESDDGLTTWNVFDARLRVGAPHPVRRFVTAPAGMR